MGSLPPSKPPTGPAPPRRPVCAPRGPSPFYRRPPPRWETRPCRSAPVGRPESAGPRRPPDRPAAGCASNRWRTAPSRRATCKPTSPRTSPARPRSTTPSWWTPGGSRRTRPAPSGSPAGAPDVSTVYTRRRHPGGRQPRAVRQEPADRHHPGRGARPGRCSTPAERDETSSSAPSTAPATSIPRRPVHLRLGDRPHHRLERGRPVPADPVAQRPAHRRRRPGAVYTGLAIGNSRHGRLPLRGRLRQRQDRRLRPDLHADHPGRRLRRSGHPRRLRPVQHLEPRAASCTSPTPGRTNGDALPDGGHGFVSVFDTNGNFLSRLVADSH